ncbi:TatD family hydrolase [Psychrobacter sp. B38]|uniref:TatD family hydrolase n=1 Tax=Psychrobacter sp. B38 TaxID=3143538 RepID=UPI00320F7491
MTTNDSHIQSEPILPRIYPLIDTHTHFDAPVFDNDRDLLTRKAYEQGVRHLVLVGYLYQHFERMYATEQSIKQTLQSSITDNDAQDKSAPNVHIALGLHPFYIERHNEDDLKNVAKKVAEQRPLAIGEIGLDTFTATMKEPDIFAKQERFFKAQLDIAVAHQLPVMLHIRKAHAEVLAILKAHEYDAHKLGGIAHSFSGGVQEAKAFVKLGFKLGVTGQITNPNAKKLRLAIQGAVEEYGLTCLVIETDCPDMTPIMCQKRDSTQGNTQDSRSSMHSQSTGDEYDDVPIHDRNEPANLPWVLSTLSELLDVAPAVLAEQLWHNSCTALQTTWTYSK